MTSPSSLSSLAPGLVGTHSASMTSSMYPVLYQIASLSLAPSDPIAMLASFSYCWECCTRPSSGPNPQSFLSHCQLSTNFRKENNVNRENSRTYREIDVLFQPKISIFHNFMIWVIKFIIMHDFITAVDLGGRFSHFFLPPLFSRFHLLSVASPSSPSQLRKEIDISCTSLFPSRGYLV